MSRARSRLSRDDDQLRRVTSPVKRSPTPTQGRPAPGHDREPGQPGSAAAVQDQGVQPLLDGWSTTCRRRSTSRVVAAKSWRGKVPRQLVRRGPFAVSVQIITDLSSASSSSSASIGHVSSGTRCSTQEVDQRAHWPPPQCTPTARGSARSGPGHRRRGGLKNVTTGGRSAIE